MPIMQIVRDTCSVSLPDPGSEPLWWQPNLSDPGNIYTLDTASTMEQVLGFPAFREPAVHLFPAHPWMTSLLVSRSPL